MRPEEALSVVAAACAEFRGTLKDHQTIQEALQVLKSALEPKQSVGVSTEDK